MTTETLVTEPNRKSLLSLPRRIRRSLQTCLRKTWQRQKAYAELEGEAGVAGIFQRSLPGVALRREALGTRIVTEVGDCIWHILCLAHSIYVCHNSYLCSLIRSERRKPTFPPPLENQPLSKEKSVCLPLEQGTRVEELEIESRSTELPFLAEFSKELDT